MRQSRAALPQLMTLLKMAETTRFCVLVFMKSKHAAHRPDVTVLNTEMSENVASENSETSSGRIVDAFVVMCL